jgi:hypothetical protein
MVVMMAHALEINVPTVDGTELNTFSDKSAGAASRPIVWKPKSQKSGAAYRVS